jgi:hypothetical protein
MNNRYYDTKIIKIGFKHYCVYCGNEAYHEFESHDYNRIDYHNCDCDGAKAEREFQLEVDKLHKKYDNLMIEDINKINELKFIYEARELKKELNNKKEMII